MLAHAVEAHVAEQIVIDSDTRPARSIVAKEIERCDKAAVSLDRTLDICNQMNRRLGLLK